MAEEEIFNSDIENALCLFCLVRRCRPNERYLCKFSAVLPRWSGIILELLSMYSREFNCWLFIW